MNCKAICYSHTLRLHLCHILKKKLHSKQIACVCSYLHQPHTYSNKMKKKKKTTVTDFLFAFSTPHTISKRVVQTACMQLVQIHKIIVECESGIKISSLYFTRSMWCNNKKKCICRCNICSCEVRKINVS